MAGGTACVGTSFSGLQAIQNVSFLDQCVGSGTAPHLAGNHQQYVSNSISKKRRDSHLVAGLWNTGFRQSRSNLWDLGKSGYQLLNLNRKKLSHICNQAGNRSLEAARDEGERTDDAGARLHDEEISRKEVIGVIIVDHGSRRAESNRLLDSFVDLYKAHTGRSLVEPAHMEIARPSIADAFDKVVERGANVVVVSPYFLSPGRHWFQDIPDLAAEASKKHPGMKYLVTAPIGLHPLMAEIIEDRIEHCLQRSAGKAEECDVCIGSDRCKMVTS